MEQPEERSYIAFISYRHLPLDKKVAELIQQKIEHFVVPKEYRDRVGGRDRLGLVFRDEDELPVGQSLSSSITYALDHSQYLIVICTPDLPKSQWCEKEIRYFIETHDRDHVIAVLADGDPAESFSPYLRFDYANDGTVRAEVEPLAANIDGPDKKIDKKKFHKEIVRVYAALLRCPFDALWQREKRYQAARLGMIAATVFLAMAVFLAVVIRKNVKITQQNRDLEYQKSSILVSTGQQQLDASDIQGAVDTARQAMENRETMPYDLHAQALLVEALGAYQSSFSRNELVLEQTSVIVDAWELSDGHILTADQFGMVRCYDETGRQVLWTASSQSKGSEIFQTDLETRLEINETAGIVFCVNDLNVKALSMKDGSEIWDFPKQAENNFFTISEDASRIAVISFDSPAADAIPTLKVLSAGSGDITLELPITLDGFSLSRGYAGQPVSGGAFSEDGRYLALVLAFDNDADYELLVHQVLLVDLETGSMERILTRDTDNDFNTVVLGVHVSSSGEQIYAVIYDGAEKKVYRMFMRRGSDKYDYYAMSQVSSYHAGYTPLGRHLYLPAVCEDDQIVTVFNNMVYVDDWKTELVQYVGEQDEPILAVEFSESNPSAIHLLTSDGSQREDIPDEQSWWQEFEGTIIMRFGRLVGDDWEFLYTTEETPNRLMKLVNVPADPHGQALAEGTVALDRSYYTCLSPSGNSLFVLAPSYSEAWPLDVYSATDWSLLCSLTFDPVTESLAPAVNPIDDESIMVGLRIYHTDGSISYLESYEEEKLEEARYLFSAARSVTLQDGTVISVTGDTLYPPGPEVWKDGRGVDQFFSCKGFVDGRKAESFFRVSSEDVYVLGKNGYLIMRGVPVYKEEEGLYYIEDEESVYYLWNVREDTTIIIPDGCPEDLMHKVVSGEETPVFAVADSEGGIRIYSAETKDSFLLSSAYSTGPVRAMGFFGGDQYLAVYTYTGRMDIYQIDTGEMVFSEDNPYSSQYVELIEAYEDHAGRLLLIGKVNAFTYGDCVVIDQEEWAVTARIQNVFAYSNNSEQIVARRDGEFVCYPLYTADDLLSWE
ncbi:MAG: toll/interleukin-1 receptor domain-containing protein [Firmicutes bacterium]|nr:toll/interleukin-1 receptor domain-containing protein [Bacillota bacterium]